MNIMVMNCGSSSLKYRLIAMPEEQELAGGEAQRVGPPTAEPSRIYHRIAGREETHTVPMPDHATAFREVMKLLERTPELKPDALGHRVVHGAAIFKDHTLVDDDTIAGLEKTLHLAPIHNPPAVTLLKACYQMYPELPESVVFDTSYHSTMPAHASTYALPRSLREDEGIRKYGFHGTSHRFVVQEAARFLNIPLDRFNGVSCHLGSGGASLCAVVGGRSMDNTMGYSPLQGLMMSTRSGDLDPAIVLRLLAQSGGNADAVEKKLNRKSGVLGMSGVSSDIRDIFKMMNSGDEVSEQLNRTSSLYIWRLRKYLGAYLSVVGRADAVIFTDTIGETMPQVRWMVCADMDVFGIRMDMEKNDNVTSWPVDVAAPDSPVRLLVIRTNEELAIARETWRLLQGGSPDAMKGVA